MITLKHAAGSVAAALSAAALMQYGITTHAQNATHTCKPAQVIPLTARAPSDLMFRTNVAARSNEHQPHLNANASALLERINVRNA